MFPHAATEDGIQSGRGLVEEDQLGLVNQRRGQPYSPSHTPGYLVHPLALGLLELYELEDGVTGLGPLSAAQTVEGGGEVEILAHRERFIESGFLGQVADP
jgi:hypothetical protein